MVATVPVAPFAAFVDRVGDGETVLLDLNDGVTFKTLEGFEFPPPPLTSVVVEGLLRDGAEIPVSAYGLNTVTIPLAIEAATQDAVEDAVQALARILDTGGILRWQETSTPVYAVVERSPVYERELRLWAAYRKVTLKLTVQPFLLGQPLYLSVDNVPNDPAADSPVFGVAPAPASIYAPRGQHIMVDGLPGTVSSPPVVALSLPDGAMSARVVLASRPGAADLVAARQAEAMPLPSGTVLQANTATASGAGQNFIRSTNNNFLFTVDHGANRPSVDRVYVRVRTTSTTATVTGIDGVVRPVSATSPAWQYVYVGLLAHAQGTPDRVGYGAGFTNYQGDVAQSDVTVTVGVGTFDLDVIVYVPADTAVAQADVEANIFPFDDVSDALIIDGPNDTAYSVSVGGSLVTSLAGGMGASNYMVDHRFGTALLKPDSVNHLRLMVSRGVTDDRVADTTDVAVRYYPRYLTPP